MLSDTDHGPSAVEIRNEVFPDLRGRIFPGISVERFPSTHDFIWNQADREQHLSFVVDFFGPWAISVLTHSSALTNQYATQSLSHEPALRLAGRKHKDGILKFLTACIDRRR